MAFHIFAFISSITFPRAAPFESLRAILTQANPPIRDESSPPRTMQPGRTAAPASRFEVSNWTDFNLEMLMEAYGDILNEQVQLTNHAPTEVPSIRSLADLKTVEERHIFPILQCTIEARARHIGIRLERHLPTSEFHPSLSFRGFRPAFTLLSGDDEALIVRAADTRYGFILTSNEVVVVRVSTAGMRKAFHVKWQAIPWGASGDGVLTVNLALWFLAMMSLNDDHRPVCKTAELLPLNSWSRSMGSNGQMVYQHHLSMCKRLDLPASAVYTEV
ncbi:hypothetical protein NCS52_01374400 [Fusarium sp. LHS14.1]|nr:hypothetical protein NCS52_01374400 [Fusarium sp. LHS14.1]